MTVTVLCACFAVFGQASASAAVPALLTSFPADTSGGSAADQLAGPRGIATDPLTGNVYVAEASNGRVSEFNPWGEFVKAFGWDVAPGAVNEQQEVRVRAAAGQLKLTFGAATTGDLAFDATAEQVETALNGLPTISAGGGAVSVEGGPGGIAGTTPAVYVVTFDSGPLAAADVDQISAANGTTPLAGGAPSTSLAVRTRADGAVAGVGLEACTAESGCQQGTPDGAPGQINPNGVSVDSHGDVYVLERLSSRVQKFDSAGRFLLMIGGEVNRTTKANLCTKADIAAGDVCAGGVNGTGDGAFEPPVNFFAGSYMAVGPGDVLFVGDKDRVQSFNPNGSFKGKLPLPQPGSPDHLVVDPLSGDLYLSYVPFAGAQLNPPVFRIDSATGQLLDTLPVEAPEAGRIEALATDPGGNLFVSFDIPGSAVARLEARVFQFDPSGEVVFGYDQAFASPPVASRQVNPVLLPALGTNAAGNLYVAENGSGNRIAVSAYGPPPLSFAPPPLIPPEITEQFATSVATKAAVVRAQINPRFWDDTRFYVEYGTESCEASACATQPVPPGALLTDEIVNAPLKTTGVTLSGLDPSTTYHYRFVAESTGGGPVKGLAGKVGEEAEATFTTAALTPPQPSCSANEAFRPGFGGLLPDCRAYEMVSPVDKNGADISVVLTVSGEPAALNQASLDGNGISYSAFRAFGDAESSPYTSQYLATRAGSGWGSTSISPLRKGPSLFSVSGLDSQYKAFSDDLCLGWLVQDSDLALAEGAVEGWPDFYRRDICGDSFQALGPLRAPRETEIDDFRPELQGVSADGSKAILLATGRLTNGASRLPQLYEASQGELRLVCVLPDGTALKTGCSAGTPSPQEDDRHSGVSNAYSDDGSTIYWMDDDEGEGRLFVRVGGTETVAVSPPGPDHKAQFWTAATNGSLAFYSVEEKQPPEDELFEFDLATRTSTSIVKGFEGVMGASDDASKLYLVSREVKAAGATAGQPNLYLYERGDPARFTYIATLAGADLGAQFSPVAIAPVFHTSQVTAGGGAVTFMSVAKPGLTGLDNTDAVSGQPDAQVYLYRADADELLCISCNPTGARPHGRQVKDLWVAGQIPAAENQLHAPRVISADGSRVFFESFDALVLRDTNSQLDVYEWEFAGSGNCTSAAPGFREVVSGCVNLISSGESPEGSELVDSSADGRDVFFATNSSLLPQDPGLIDIYDARAGGGFPLPPPPAPQCVGEACQRPNPVPNDPTPASQAFVGPGDELQCRKGTHSVTKKGKTACVKNAKPKKKKHKGSKSKGRGAGR
ncbi:MAG TPA: hypothetical protein VFX45_08260 [Solirubrobacterales bacterium]|nr:hypothetical protein [Solirubrobacterales bacterium]